MATWIDSSCEHILCILLYNKQTKTYKYTMDEGADVLERGKKKIIKDNRGYDKTHF